MTWEYLNECSVQGGYYLTSFSSAIRVIKTYSNIANAIPQQFRLPSVDDMQSAATNVVLYCANHVAQHCCGCTFRCLAGRSASRPWRSGRR